MIDTKTIALEMDATDDAVNADAMLYNVRPTSAAMAILSEVTLTTGKCNNNSIVNYCSK
jgi:hypothetical protein